MRSNRVRYFMTSLTRYWDEDYWSDYNIIEPTRITWNTLVEKLKRNLERLYPCSNI